MLLVRAFQTIMEHIILSNVSDYSFIFSDGTANAVVTYFKPKPFCIIY